MANFDLAEYLALDPWTALIKIINDEYLLQLEPRQTTLVSFTATGEQTVTLVVQANRSTTNENILPPLDPQTFKFTRLRLPKYFAQAGGYTLTNLTLPFTTLEVMQAIAGDGVVFDIDDFYQHTYTAYPTGAITVDAKEESLRWVGSLSVKVVNNSKIDLAVINNVEVPTAVRYPNADLTKAQGYYYTNPFDFSEYRDQLKTLGKYKNTIQGSVLADILTTVTGEQWVCSPTPAVRNIAYSVENEVGQYSIAYHGPATERYTARQSLPTVILLELSETLCTGVSGALRLHYT